MRVEPVPRTRCLADEVLARLEEEMQLTRPIGQPDGQQVRLTGRHPGDREGVTRIALARPPGPPALGTAQVRWHLADTEPGALDRSRKRRPERRRALDADRRLGR